MMRPLSGAASAPRFLGVSPLRKNRGLTPNGTYFTPVTRSVSEGNKGKRLLSSPSLTLRVSKVSAIGLTPPRSETSHFVPREVSPWRKPHSEIGEPYAVRLRVFDRRREPVA